MNPALFLLLWTAMSAQSASVQVDAQFVMRRDLPEGFPVRAQDKGYAVLHLKIANAGTSAYDFDPVRVSVRNPKGKALKSALPEEITPKIVKAYQGRGAALNADIWSGARPEDLRARPGPGSAPAASGPNIISLDMVHRLRAALEHFELDAAEIAPGETLEGYLYFKSKHTGRALAGSKVVLDGIEAVVP